MRPSDPSLVIARRAFDAAIFDLDGVITRTAEIHAEAWKRLFDTFLAERAGRGEHHRPFDLERDYPALLDGRPRLEGAEAFLASRGIALPRGAPHDPPERETVWGLAHRKNRIFRALLAERGVPVIPSAVALIRTLRRHGFLVGLATSSRNGRIVLRATGLEGLFDAVVDGVDAARLHLTGKPAPDLFLEVARRLSVPPGRAVLFEDAIVGVQAGRRGGFGRVIGVDRGGQAVALRHAGADAVVSDLDAITVEVGPFAPPPEERAP